MLLLAALRFVICILLLSVAESGEAQTVPKVTPTVTASVVSSPIPYGSIATVNVQVSCNSACGSVDYKVNGVDWGTVALNSSGFFSAARAAGEDAPGTYSVTITYLGNANYNLATSNTVTFTVTKATPTVTASVVSSPVPYGSIATVNVQVSCNSACGSVDYKINGSEWGTAALNSSGFFSAGRAAGEDAPGAYSVTITYPGNANYNSATSNTVTFTVTKATPTVTASVVSSPVPYGSIATVNVQVSCNSACGSVDYKINGSEWGTAALNSSGFFSAGRAAGEDAPGAYSVTISYTGNGNYNPATSNTATFTVTKAAQTITFTAPATTVTYGVPPTTLSATASSSLPVTFSVSSGPANVSGSTLAITGAGTIVVAANQPGNANYSPAASVSYTIVVNQAPLISISNIPSSATYGGSFTATYSYSGSGSPTESVSSISPSVCMVTGNIVSYVGTGTCILEASATATPGYTAATGSAQRFTVTKSMLTVTASNASRAYGAANPTFMPAYSGFVNGDTASVLTGAPSLTTTATTMSTVATYPVTAAVGTLAATNYTFNYVNGILTVTQATPVITWAQPFNIQPGTALSTAQLNAVANASGSFSYSPAAGAVLSSGYHILTATFTPNSSTNYSSANATVTLTVSFSPNASIITTVAGNGTAGYGGNGGAATSALLDNPTGVSVDASGNIYIADAAHGYIRKVNVTTGIITTIAGNGQAYSANGPAASTGLGIPIGIALDAAGNVYISDGYQSRVLKLTATTGMIASIAGNGTAGWGGDGGAATSAYLNSPSSVAVDASGSIYIADGLVIRKVNPAGIISTIAGNETYGYSGDNGPATSAALNIPMGVSVDASGNIYIADWSNNRIRKVNTAGIITTVAGNGTAGYSGDGGVATSAELNAPESVYVDASGDVYIADGGNNRIRKVNAAGIITTVAGNGTSGYSGDSGIATSAELNLVGWSLGEVFVDPGGTIYISDSNNNRIRAVGPTSNVLAITVTTSGSPSVYGSPVTFTATVPSGDTNTVTFYSGGSPLGAVTPSNGIARLTISSLAVGVNPITASIAGNGSYPPATSALIDQIVNQLAPTVSISNIPSSAGYGGSFTATYNYSGNGSPSASSSTLSVCSVSDGTVNYLNPGTCTLQASVSATATYAAATGSSQSFTVSPPTISSLSPTSGPESTPVTISGLGFGVSPDTTTVAFNGVLANLSSWGNTSLVTKVPIGATTGNVVVTANGTASNGILFTVNATTPTITSLSASSGNVGLAVTISGSGFGAKEGQSTVTFNGITAGVLNWNDSAIIAIVPFGATTGPVIVTRSDGQTSNANIVFTVASGAICNY
jgi:sugar lactone lactonase YvrE